MPIPLDGSLSFHRPIPLDQGVAHVQIVVETDARLDCFVGESDEEISRAS